MTITKIILCQNKHFNIKIKSKFNQPLRISKIHHQTNLIEIPTTQNETQ